MRHLFEGHVSDPLVLASPAWHRHLASSCLANGHAAGDVVADVSGLVRIDEVESRALDLSNGAYEFVPVPGLVEHGEAVEAAIWGQGTAC